MNAQSLTIEAPAVVTMTANSKLNLTGDGQPLTGNGLLDVTTHAPNSLEYTGRATADVTAAGPIQGKLGNTAPANLQIPPRFEDVTGALDGERTVQSQTPSLMQGLKTQDPSRMLPGSFSRNDSLTLAANEEYPWAAAIDTVNGFAYFGTLARNTPGIIVKVRLSDFTRVGALVLNPGDDPLRCATIDIAGGFAYFGGFYGDIIKVRLSDFTRIGAIETGATFTAAVIDTDNGFAYFGGYTGPGAVVKVRLSDFTAVDVLVLNTGENGILSAAIDTINGFAYFGTSSNNTNNPAYVVKVRLSDFTRVGAVTLSSNEMNPTCAVIDTVNGFAYFGIFDNFYIIVKIRLSDFTRVGALNPNDGLATFLRSAVIDTTNGEMVKFF